MKKQFETESKRILDLMINSIYTNKEIFLRELISNASDALDKRYIEDLKNEDVDFNRDDYYILLERNEDDRTLTIKDNGIGMTAEELENNLGVIAKSGSLDFKSKLKDQDDVSIIGQFGVGFYSAFMVADKIEVVSKSYGSDQAYSWTSEGSEGYVIEEAKKDDYGTEIKLYIKENTEEEDGYNLFLDEYYIKQLIEKYSNYIKYPIKMEVSKSRNISDNPEEPEYEDYKEIEILNSMTPIWKKRKADLEDEDYKNFYHEKRFGFDEPLKWIHVNAEGLINYRAILYIPSEAPFDYYTKDYKKGLELYSNGVMIMEKNEDLIPDYFSFVKGVVDSEDLSLNISREILQQDRRLMTIANKLEQKINQELKSMMDKDRKNYEKFYQSFGMQLKAGIYQTYGMKKDELEDLLLFYSSRSKDLISLKEYVENMKEDQEEIYYISGDSYEQIDRLPSLQKIKENDLEILYLIDDIDEFMIKMMLSYDDKAFVSALDKKFDSEEKDLDEVEKKNQDELFAKMKDLLDDEVVEVKESKRLVDDASCLVARGEISIDMEKTFMHQPDASMVKAEKVLEINSDHKIYKDLMEAFSSNDEDKLGLYTSILYDQARLIEGLPLKNAVKYTQNVMKLI